MPVLKSRWSVSVVRLWKDRQEWSDTITVAERMSSVRLAGKQWVKQEIPVSGDIDQKVRFYFEILRTAYPTLGWWRTGSSELAIYFPQRSCQSVGNNNSSLLVCAVAKKNIMQGSLHTFLVSAGRRWSGRQDNWDWWSYTKTYPVAQCQIKNTEWR